MAVTLLAGYRTVREFVVAGKLHIIMSGKISLVLIETPMSSNGLSGGHLQLVVFYRLFNFNNDTYITLM
jgi:hypothetical protein